MSIYQGVVHNSRWVPKNLRTTSVKIKLYQDRSFDKKWHDENIENA